MFSVSCCTSTLHWREKTDTRKITLLLTITGPQALEVFNTFVFTDAGNKDKFDKVTEKFDEHCSHKENELRWKELLLVIHSTGRGDEGKFQSKKNRAVEFE